MITTLAGLLVMGTFGVERQITTAPHGHVLTNVGVWSADGKWIAYDVRSDAEGAVFDGTRIERVNVETDEVQVLYEAREGACVGIVTCSPAEEKVVFIHGPERPTAEWSYAANRRRGVILEARRPGAAVNLDARDLTPPFTPGALRGGSHVHVFSGDGAWVSFTYQDQVLARFKAETASHEIDLRNVGVSVPAGPVRVQKDHPRNHDGEFFSVLVTRTTATPRPGSDEISKAFEDAWVGTGGYVRVDGTRQRRALAFQGYVVTANGETISEVFVVDLPEDPRALMIPGDGPLEGTETLRPRPPRGIEQRRLTFTAERRYPGIQGPRHWLRSAPDGSRIGFLMRDEGGVVQFWTVSPNGGAPVQVTSSAWDVASAFTWSPDGRFVAFVADGSVFVTEVATGAMRRLTPRSSAESAPRPEACVFSPDGRRIAYVRRAAGPTGMWNQIFFVGLEEGATD